MQDNGTKNEKSDNRIHKVASIARDAAIFFGMAAAVFYLIQISFFPIGVSLVEFTMFAITSIIIFAIINMLERVA